MKTKSPYTPKASRFVLNHKVLSSLAVVSLIAVHATAQSCYPPPTGIAGWWPAESNANDLVNGNDGTVIGGLTYASGEVGSAFQFDGSTSYISVPASFSLDIGSTNGTGVSIESWIKPSPNLVAPIAEWDSSSTDGLQFWVSGGDLFANIKDTSGNAHEIYYPVAFDTNDFQHVAVTYDKSSGIAVLYYNGSAIDSANLGSFTPQTAFPTYNLNIGRRLGQPIGLDDTFKGLIDELSVYNRALTACEIEGIYEAGAGGKCHETPVACYPPPSGIAGWWPAESNATDIVSGRAGTVFGSLSYASGEVGSAFQFDGSTSYISMLASFSLDIGSTNGTGVSIESWIKPSPNLVAPIAEWDSSSTDGLQFWVSGGDLFANIKDTLGNAHEIYYPVVFNTNSFQHVAVTYDKSSGTAVLYYNGSAIDSANLGSFMPQTAFPTYNLNIGRRLGQPIGLDDTFKGLIDELSVYNRALTACEIQGIYNAGTNGKCR